MGETKRTRTLNERFTDLADTVSQKIGEWPITAFAIFCLCAWIVLGLPLHWSDTWQLIANTPTTWVELFLGFLCAAATNRAEKHLHALLGRITDLEEANARMECEHGAQLADLATVAAAQRDEIAVVKRLNEEQSAILCVLHEQSTASVRDPKTGRYRSRKSQPLAASVTTTAASKE